MANSPEVTFENHLKNLRKVLADIAKHSGLSGKALTKLANNIRLNGVHTDYAVSKLEDMADVDKKVAAEAIKTALAIDNKTKALDRNQLEQLDLIKHQESWLIQQKKVKQAQEIDIHNWKEETRLSKLHSQAIIENNKRDKQALEAKKKVVEANRKHTEKLRILIDRMKEAGLDTRKFVIENKKLIKASKNNTVAMDRLNRAVKNYNVRLKKGWFNVRNFRNANGELGMSFSVLRSKLLLVSFGVGLVTRTFGRALKSTIQASSTFETLQTRLNALYGSTLRGATAFNVFNDVAATTPFQLNNVVDAGAKLKAFGVDAENMIKPVADLAAFMGVDIVDAAGAMGRAFAGGAGAADILRERGILNLIKTTQGIDDLSKITLPEFRKALISTLQDPVSGIAGSTDKLSKTYAGSVSNMQDSVTRFAAEIGKVFQPAAKSFADSIKSMADAGAEFLVSSKKIDLATVLQGNNVKDLEVKLKAYEEALRLAEEGNLDSVKAFGSFTQGIGLAFPRLKIAGDIWNHYNKRNVEGIENIKDSKLQISILQGTIGDLQHKLHLLNETSQSNNDLSKEGDDNFNSFATTAERLATPLEKLNKLYSQTDSAKKDLILSQIRELALLQNSLPMSEENADIHTRLAKTINHLQGEYHDLNIEIDKFINISKDLIDFVEKVDPTPQFEKFGFEDQFTKLEKILLKIQEITGTPIFTESELREGIANFTETTGEIVNASSGVTDALKEQVNIRMKNDMNAMKNTVEYQKSNAKERKALEKSVTDRYAKERTNIAKGEKAMAIAEATIHVANAIAANLKNPIMAGIVGVLGAIQIGTIVNTPIPKFQRGGLVGGNRHSQGGTMIEAERGEFVMSRNAVKSVGLETMNRINQGAGATSNVTVNVSGNVLTQDYVEGELAENIKEAIRRGSDFGLN